MTIGALAKKASVSVDTIRYYERGGLLPLPARRISGYREYGDADVKRLRFVRRAGALGFTLVEIAELLSLSADRDVAGVKRRAEHRLTQVEHKIAELNRIRRGLEKLVAACPGHGDLEHCPIIAALSGEDSR